jgi:hypothetical protein
MGKTPRGEKTPPKKYSHTGIKILPFKLIENAIATSGTRPSTFHYRSGNLG